MTMNEWIVDTEADYLRDEDEAIDRAYDLLETTPALVGDWLAKVCDVVQTDWLPHNPFRLGRWSRMGMIELTPAQALAVLFGSTEQDASHALHHLRTLYKEHVKDDAETQGRAAWKKQCDEDKQINERGFYEE